MKLTRIIALLFSFCCANTLAAINIVSAENVYGEVAKAIGGPEVKVMSILNNPNQDPHLFTTRPSDAIAVSHADVIIYNGANYDPWMLSLLRARNQKQAEIIVVADLLKLPRGANPHIWYNPETLPRLAQQLTTVLTQLDPKQSQEYTQRFQQWTRDYQTLHKLIQQMRQRFNGTAIIATESLFNDMAQALGLSMQGIDFQNSIMNDLPPSISQIKTFQQALRQHRATVLIYNSQVSNPLTQRMIDIAKKEGIATVGMSETQPAQLNYVQWMTQQLLALQKALILHQDRTHE